MKRVFLLGVVAAMAVAMLALPASAAVHEITGMACGENSEHGGNPFPPGVSDDTARNFAQPLFANGFIESIVPYADGILINFDFDHPASKLKATGGGIVALAPGIYVEEFEHDGAYTNCNKLRH
jgi:hypothetical protein